MKLLVSIFFLLLPSLLLSQKEAYNWTFGHNILMQFSENEPPKVILNGSEIRAGEGCASFSDTKGNLLLYTDGVKLWDSQNNVVLDNLAGDHSSTQSGVIIQHSNSDDIFVFTAPVAEFTDILSEKNNKGLRYSIVRQNDSGYDVVTQDILLHRPTTECITAVEHSNETDQWIISKQANSNIYYSFLLTETGITTNYASRTGRYYDFFGESSIGYLKASPDGRLLAHCSYGKGYLELFKFDNVTGKITKLFDLTDSLTNNIYGIEFSPDASHLYTTTTNDSITYLTQYDLSYLSEDDMKENKVIVSEIKSPEGLFGFGALQLGPDGKVYVANHTMQTLDVISKPNREFPNNEFLNGEVNLLEGNLKLGLPNFSQSYFKPEAIIDSLFACRNEGILIVAKLRMGSEIDSIHWEGPNNFYSRETNVFIENANSENEGSYRYTVFFDGKSRIDSIFVVLNERPDIKLNRDKYIICDKSGITIEVEEADPTLNYFWSDGQTGPFAQFYEEGDYFVRAYNETFCSDTFHFRLDYGSNESLTLNEEYIFEFDCDAYEPQTKLISLYNFRNDDAIISDINFKNADIFDANLSETSSETAIEVTAYPESNWGIYSDTLLITFDNYCISEIEIPIRKIIYRKIESSIYEYELEIGEKDHPIDVKFRSLCENDFVNLPQFTAELEYNHSIISLDSASTELFEVELLSDDNSIITMQSVEELEIQNALTTVFASTYLNENTLTPVAINSIVWADSLIKNIFIDGSVRISEICMHNVRSVAISNQIEYLNVSTVMQQEVINIEAKVSTSFTLAMIDNSGKTIFEEKVAKSDNSNTLFEFSKDISLIPQGIYYVYIISESKKFVEPIIIVK